MFVVTPGEKSGNSKKEKFTPTFLVLLLLLLLFTANGIRAMMMPLEDPMNDGLFSLFSFVRLAHHLIDFYPVLTEEINGCH